MAKGRKVLTTSRSERFLGSFGFNRSGGSGTTASELEEDEVWSIVDDAVAESDHSTNGDWNVRVSTDYRSQQRPPPRRYRHHQVGGLSLAFDDSSDVASSSPRIVHQFRPQDGSGEPPRGRHVATSAPVNVPDWSKIYRVDSVESIHDSDDESELVPPHEYLAREHARSRKMVANSVFEGVGRTLKGRDMSRVRDAVWSQTGFDG